MLEAYGMRSSKAALVCLLSMLIGASADARPLSIDDVLATVAVDRADISADSEEIAIAMPRPATPGEVYGRNSYEIDSSRTDIWLVKRDGSQLRRLTDGKGAAAGFWCPYWSPDGQRLAMLSTAPEQGEPHGGDNVRLYVWERGADAPRRVSDRAMMTQVRYGSPLNELDLRGAGASRPNTCRDNDENAPFLWLGPDRLLAVLMPPGENSAMVDRYPKFHREALRAGKEMRAGEVPTVSRSESATAAAELAEGRYSTELVIFNLADGSTTKLGKVPAFPMFGALTIALSPDARSAAILAPVQAIPPHRRSPEMPNVMAWAVENALFILDLGERPGLQQVETRGGAQYPLDIIGWSPGSEYVALRTRAAADATSASLWTLAASDLALTAQAPSMTFNDAVTAHWREGSYPFGPTGHGFWCGIQRQTAVGGLLMCLEVGWKSLRAAPKGWPACEPRRGARSSGGAGPVLSASTPPHAGSCHGRVPAQRVAAARHGSSQSGKTGLPPTVSGSPTARIRPASRSHRPPGCSIMIAAGLSGLRAGLKAAS
jgi:hypothetical protein